MSGRPRFSTSTITEIRRTRLEPRRGDYLYLHLRILRDDLREALRGVEARDALDVYCGARPYEPLLPPGVRCLGLDIDDAYGCADVISSEFLPFDDSSFDLCLCTQAFYFLEDPVESVRELQRVLRPGGLVVLTIPVAYPGTMRLYSRLQLEELFGTWEDVSVVPNGGTVVSVVTLVCHLFHRAGARVPLPGVARALSFVYLGVNVVGEAVHRLEERRLHAPESFPANLLLTARTPR